MRGAVTNLNEKGSFAMANTLKILGRGSYAYTNVMVMGIDKTTP